MSIYLILLILLCAELIVAKINVRYARLIFPFHISGVLTPRRPQEILCRDHRSQPQLRKTYTIDHRLKC